MDPFVLAGASAFAGAVLFWLGDRLIRNWAAERERQDRQAEEWAECEQRYHNARQKWREGREPRPRTAEEIAILESLDRDR